MTEISTEMPSILAKPYRSDRPRKAATSHKEADGAFLRRILFGLIAATVISGAVTVALVSQADLLSERLEVASTQGPA